MVSKGLFALVIIGFGFFTLSVMILPISNQVNELRTDSQTDTALACTTGAAATDAGAGAMPLLAPVARCSPPWLLKEARRLRKKDVQMIQRAAATTATTATTAEAAADATQSSPADASNNLSSSSLPTTNGSTSMAVKAPPPALVPRPLSDYFKAPASGDDAAALRGPASGRLPPLAPLKGGSV